jgi:hypothetical protein
MSRAIRDGRAHRLHQGAAESPVPRELDRAVVSEPEWEVAFSPEDVDRVAALVHEKFCADLATVTEPERVREGVPEWLDLFAELQQEQKETFRGMVLAVMDAMATVAVEKRNVRRDRSGH